MRIEKNLGTADRIVRLVFAVVVTTLYLTGIISGPVAGGLLILSVIFVVTVVFSFCPAYHFFDMKSRNKRYE